MEKMTLRYPGDPPSPVEVVSREEFFSIFPPEERAIEISHIDAEGQVCVDSVTPLGQEVICDSCNGNAYPEPNDGQKAYLVRRSRLYCEECFDQMLRRYCR